MVRISDCQQAVVAVNKASVRQCPVAIDARCQSLPVLAQFAKLSGTTRAAVLLKTGSRTNPHHTFIPASLKQASILDFMSFSTP